MTSPAPQKELNSYTGTYVMYLSEGQIIVTGREKFKNFKAVFCLDEGRDLISCASHNSTTSAEQVFDRLSEFAHKKFGEYKDVVNGFDFFVEDLLAELLELRAEAQR